MTYSLGGERLSVFVGDQLSGRGIEQEGRRGALIPVSLEAVDSRRSIAGQGSTQQAGILTIITTNTIARSSNLLLVKEGRVTSSVGGGQSGRSGGERDSVGGNSDEDLGRGETSLDPSLDSQVDRGTRVAVVEGRVGTRGGSPRSSNIVYSSRPILLSVSAVSQQLSSRRVRTRHEVDKVKVLSVARKIGQGISIWAGETFEGHCSSNERIVAHSRTQYGEEQEQVGRVAGRDLVSVCVNWICPNGQ